MGMGWSKGQGSCMYYIYKFVFIKTRAHEHGKTLAKHQCGKKPVATRVQKIKIENCSPLR